MSGPLISRVVFGPPSRAPAVSHSIMAAHPGHRQKLLIVNASRLISGNYTGGVPLSPGLCGVSSLTSSDMLNLSAGLELELELEVFSVCFWVYAAKCVTAPSLWPDIVKKKKKGVILLYSFYVEVLLYQYRTAN